MAVGGAIAGMQLTRSLHPPGGAVALLLVLAGFCTLLPFALAMVVVLVFEFDQWRNQRREAPIR